MPQESTQSKILVDGKELPDFAEDRQDYQITYKGQRPKVSVEESNQVASTVVDSGEDSLPVLVRLVSESGKQVKEYRIPVSYTHLDVYKRQVLIRYHQIPSQRWS